MDSSNIIHLNPFEHALIRPDVYIGGIETEIQDNYVLNFCDGTVSKKDVHYNNGLMSIIREIYSNCIDNKWRSSVTDTPLTNIKITFDLASYFISFQNDGLGIPVKKTIVEYTNHRTNKKKSEEGYPASFLFGDMMSGTNLNDEKKEERKTSGRNGIGSKATNIFSEKFVVECADAINGKKLVQTYEKNAKIRSEPIITIFKGKTSTTTITFKPDFKRFNYNIEDEETRNDFIGLLGAAVLEIAAIIMLPVHFTVGEVKKIYNIKTFQKYAQLFYPNTNSATKILQMKLKNEDECVIVQSTSEYDEDLPMSQDNVNHVSFVNGVKTKNGGTHVNSWRDLIIGSFVKAFNSRPQKGKGLAVKTTAKEVNPYLTLFIRTEMGGPEFDHQIKTALVKPKYNILPVGKTVKDKEETERIKEEVETIIKKMMKWEFVALLDAKLRGGKDVIATKTTKRPDIKAKKYIPANKAGIQPELCTLYICEGSSAKATVTRGVSIQEHGTDYNGIFAIQGKFLNVSKAMEARIMLNEEIVAIEKAMNLKRGVNYSIASNLKTLRYQHVRIMADMDDDGIHIRGLLMNFFNQWPELYKMGAIDSLSTGLIKVNFPGKDNNKIFFTISDYKKWYALEGHNIKITNVEFMKGLAAICPDDVPNYFLNPKIVNYVFDGNEKERFILGFNTPKTQIEKDNRKTWILGDMVPEQKLPINNEERLTNENEKGVCIKDTEIIKDYVYKGNLSVSSFIYNQLVIYHRMTLRRALPDSMDGLKEGQRKILYAIFKTNNRTTKDLERVTGSIKDLTGYHHGVASLYKTIGNMVTHYPGSNNIALLVNGGEFGTRMSGSDGDDCGAARYIKTMHEPIARKIFRIEDEPLLTREVEDNIEVEWTQFLPIIPLLLLNGSEGIASGFGSKFSNYNPEDILDKIRSWINDGVIDNNKPLIPWYRGINGPIKLCKDEKTGKNRWETYGILKECGEGCKVQFSFISKTNSKKVEYRKCKGEKGWWHITDLPVGKWTDSFREDLDCLERGVNKAGKKIERCLTGIRGYNTANNVHFMIKPTKDWEPRIGDTLPSMVAKRTLEKMIAIDTNNYPTKYKSVEEFLEVWCPKRSYYYEKRKEYELNKLNEDIKKENNRYIFVELVAKKKLDMNRPKIEVEKELGVLGLDRMISKKKKDKEESVEDDENEKSTKTKKDKNNGKTYDYLLSMQMSSMTTEKLEKLKKEIGNIEIKIKKLLETSPSDVWLKELDEFEVEYKNYIKSRPLI